MSKVGAVVSSRGVDATDWEGGRGRRPGCWKPLRPPGRPLRRCVQVKIQPVVMYNPRLASCAHTPLHAYTVSQRAHWVQNPGHTRGDRVSCPRNPQGPHHTLKCTRSSLTVQAGRLGQRPGHTGHGWAPDLLLGPNRGHPIAEPVSLTVASGIKPTATWKGTPPRGASYRSRWRADSSCCPRSPDRRRSR